MLQKILSLLTCLVILILALNLPALAERNASDLEQQINDLRAKIASSQNQEKTLSDKIDSINNEISLTGLKIESTQEKLDRLSDQISSVSGKIDVIGEALRHTSDVLVKRIVKTYIVGRSDPVVYLLSSSDFSDFLERLDYLQIAQKHDKTLMFNMATTQQNYKDHKGLLEEKKKQQEVLATQLQNYKTDLDRQTREKQALLTTTRSDEHRYQQLLSQAQAELSAIRSSQFSGKRNVKKGEVIGLMGSTGFSTGPHLHFGVYSLSEDQASSFNYSSGSMNPLSFLSGRNPLVYGDACFDWGSTGNRNLGSGGWDWPMGSPSITQCYGKTPYSYVYANGIHDGLDIFANILRKINNR